MRHMTGASTLLTVAGRVTVTVTSGSPIYLRLGADGGYLILTPDGC